MFCGSRKLNDRINHIHERGLRMVYSDYTSSFEELLKRNQSVTIHHRNIQLAATEMYKIKKGLSSEMLNELFRINLNTNRKNTFIIPRAKTELMGKLSLRFFGPVIWETMLPESYKNIESLEVFKEAIKKMGSKQL